MGMDYNFNQVGFTFSGFFWLMECQEMNRFQRFWIKSYGIGKWILAGYTLGLVNIILCLPLLCTGYHYHILVWKNPDRQVKRKTKMSHSYILQYLIVVFANRISKARSGEYFFWENNEKTNCWMSMEHKFYDNQPYIFLFECYIREYNININRDLKFSSMSIGIYLMY